MGRAATADSALRLGDLLGSLTGALGGGGRGVWHAGERLHLELRQLNEPETAGFVERLEDALAGSPGVGWAEVHPGLAQVVVGIDSDRADPAALVAVLEAVERDCGLEDRPFLRWGHPADDRPITLALVRAGADVLGLGLSVVGSLTVPLPAPVRVVSGAMGAVVTGVPGVRRVVESRVGESAAAVGLALGNALVQGLAQGPLGPFTDLIHHTSAVTELTARRRVWLGLEPDIFVKPSFPAPAALPGPRPGPLPDGPVERFTERSWLAGMAGAGVALVFTRDAGRFGALLMAGLPKAAIYGRDAFAAELDRALCRRGVLVLDPGALRRLDRVDCLVLPGEVTTGEDGSDEAVTRDLAAAAQRAEVEVVTTDGQDLAEEIRRLQSEDRVVAAVGTGDSAGLGAADCSVAICGRDEPIPWDADVVCLGGAADALLVVEACGTARAVSRRSVQLAMAGSGLAVIGALPGIPGGVLRASTAVHLAALASMAHGAGMAAALVHRPRQIRPPLVPWHSLDKDEVLARLDSSSGGLSSAEAARRLPPSQSAPPPLLRLGVDVGEELVNPLTPLLAGAAGLSLASGAPGDAALVAGVVGLNAVVSGVQRWRAEQAVASLRRTGRQLVAARREGKWTRVEPETLVVGDVVRFHSGEAVPVDARILEASWLDVDESSLTGESLPVAKQAAPSDAAAVADRTSMLYDGTSIAAGQVTAVVVATGPDTEAHREVPTEPEVETGVEARLRRLTQLTIPVALGSGVITTAVGMLRGQPITALAPAAVSLAVAAVPEGLPLLATVAELSAARRLARRGVLVRNTRAVEALGRIQVMCVDKTGTVTEGRIELSTVLDGEDSNGHEDAAAGDGEGVNGLSPSRRRVLAAGVRATPEPSGRLPHPTDWAVVEGAERAGVASDERMAGWSRESEMPFEPARGFHATLGSWEGGRLLSIKGAPEIVLPRCTRQANGEGDVELDDDARAIIGKRLRRLMHRGYRVLAVAERPAHHGGELDDDRVGDFTYLGLLAFNDPVRPTAAAAVADLRQAGVDVVMITGDHPSTAEGIATKLGLPDSDATVTGPELDALSDGELDARIPGVSVFARVTPAHKVRIVAAYQRRGQVVAMTGDGANDAPAIRMAEVGIALGQRSTAAARDAADLQVLDDRIETLVDAVAEGRGMWASVRDAVALLVGGNLGEIAYTVGGSLLSGQAPLGARQLLLVNLLTDVAPAMAIAVQPPAGRSFTELLAEGPEASLGKALDRAILWRAGCTAAGATGGLLVGRVTGTPARARTIGLVALVGGQLGQTLVAGRPSRATVAAVAGSGIALAGVVQTPGLSQLFGCQPLGPVGWATALAASGAATAASVVLPRLFNQGGTAPGRELAALGKLSAGQGGGQAGKERPEAQFHQHADEGDQQRFEEPVQASSHSGDHWSP